MRRTTESARRNRRNRVFSVFRIKRLPCRHGPYATARPAQQEADRRSWSSRTTRSPRSAACCTASPSRSCDKIDEIFVFDDASPDDTTEVGQGLPGRAAARQAVGLQEPRQPDVRRQPAQGLPVRDGARPRHRRAAARRRAVRPGGDAGPAHAAGERRGRHGHGLAHDGARARPSRATCRCTSTSATRSSPSSRTS